MIKQFLILILIMQANLLVAVDREPEIYAAIRSRVDFSNLTPAQEARFLPEINEKSNYEVSPLTCAVGTRNFGGDYYIRNYYNTVNWLLAHGAKVDDSKIFQEALYPLEGVCPEIVETLLWHGVSTNIKQRPLEDIEKEIGWQAYIKKSSWHEHQVEDIIVRLKKTRTILNRHEELKLRWEFIRGLVQMERARDLPQRGAGAPAGTAGAASVEVVSQTGYTPVVITRAASLS